MDDYIRTLKQAGFKGDISRDVAERDLHSHDASIYEIRPQLVIAPYDAGDVQIAVKAAHAHKTSHPTLSLTARGAGTDMSGGAVNDSVVMDFTKHMHGTGPVTSAAATVLPGTYYRDFEPETIKQDALMPAYPASRDYCTVGGMVNNDSGGEKSLQYGNVRNFVQSLRVVFADGVERDVRPLNVAQLRAKVAQRDFEGSVYRQLFAICERRYDLIRKHQPDVSKNTMGYNLAGVWDRERGIFDPTKLFTGSQGTLGITTDITFRLVPARRHSGLLILYLREIGHLGDIITEVLKHKPASFESFDDVTLGLALRHMGSFRERMSGGAYARMVAATLLDVPQLLTRRPKLVLMVEFNGSSETEVRMRIKRLHGAMAGKAARYEINGFEESASAGSSARFWAIRRASFSLLRQQVKDKHAAPFIDDLVVNPKHLQEFLPQLQKLIRRHKLFATIAGHMGDGNFHVIPLMQLEHEAERHKLAAAMRDVAELVLKYRGSLAGEHNDGMVRGPWLEQVYGPDMLALFKQTKRIFDPQNIFNPHKKTDADQAYADRHIRTHF